MNQFKTAFLMVGLTVLFVFLGNVLMGPQGAKMALIFALVMNFFSYWFSDKIVLRMYGAKEVTESEAPQLFQTVQRLTQAANLPNLAKYEALSG